MAHTPSAKKRIRQTKKRTLRNLRWKRRIKKTLKETKVKPTLKTLRNVQKVLDKATKVGVIKKNKASRLKSRLAKAVKGKKTPSTKS